MTAIPSDRMAELAASAASPTLRSQVREFHATFGVPMPEVPAVPGDERVRLRLQLLREEFFELARACIKADGNKAARRAGVSSVIGVEATDGNALDLAEHILMHVFARADIDVDIVAATDGLADCAYIVMGSFLEFGIDADPVMAEVQRSNLSKYPSTVDSNGKVMKGPHFSKPRLDEVLKEQGWKP